LPIIRRLGGLVVHCGFIVRTGKPLSRLLEE
jgi:hypothetical protein